MLLTGNEIIDLIHKHNLEERDCRFSLPKDIFESRPKKYKTLTKEQLVDVFYRYVGGERLVDLAKEYGADPNNLSYENKKYLKSLSKI